MFYQTGKTKGTLRSIQYSYGHGIAEPVHQHQVVQLLHVTKGVIRVYAQNRCWVVPPAQGVLIPAGVPHSLLAVGHADIDTVFIQPNVCTGVQDRCGVFQVTGLLRELIRTAASFDDAIALESRTARINALIIDELALLSFRDFNVVMPTSLALEKACQYVAKYPERPWTLADIAVLLSVSVRTVSRKFYAETGMSFGEWLRQLRLSTSMELMASGCSITDAALAVGYESHSSFSAMFKQRVGVSPSVFVAQ